MLMMESCHAHAITMVPGEDGVPMQERNARNSLFILQNIEVPVKALFNQFSQDNQNRTTTTPLHDTVALCVDWMIE